MRSDGIIHPIIASLDGDYGDYGDGIGFTGLPHMEHQEAHSNRCRTDVEWENFW